MGSTSEYILFVGAVVVPLGAALFWLMRTLLEWFHHIEAIIGGPFL